MHSNCRRECAKGFHGRILPESVEEISKIRRRKCVPMSTFCLVKFAKMLKSSHVRFFILCIRLIGTSGIKAWNTSAIWRDFGGRKKRELIVILSDILKSVCLPQIHAQFSILSNKLIGISRKNAGAEQFHKNSDK